MTMVDSRPNISKSSSTRLLKIQLAKEKTKQRLQALMQKLEKKKSRADLNKKKLKDKREEDKAAKMQSMAQKRAKAIFNAKRIEEEKRERLLRRIMNDHTPESTEEHVRKMWKYLKDLASRADRVEKKSKKRSSKRNIALVRIYKTHLQELMSQMEEQALKIIQKEQLQLMGIPVNPAKRLVALLQRLPDHMISLVERPITASTQNTNGSQKSAASLQSYGSRTPRARGRPRNGFKTNLRRSAKSPPCIRRRNPKAMTNRFRPVAPWEKPERQWLLSKKYQSQTYKAPWTKKGYENGSMKKHIAEPTHATRTQSKKIFKDALNSRSDERKDFTRKRHVSEPGVSRTVATGRGSRNADILHPTRLHVLPSSSRTQSHGVKTSIHPEDHLSRSGTIPKKHLPLSSLSLRGMTRERKTRVEFTGHNAVSPIATSSAPNLQAFEPAWWNEKKIQQRAH